MHADMLQLFDGCVA